MTNNFLSEQMRVLINRIVHQRILIFGLILIFALLGFEIFNFSTTEFALNDILGNLEFLGLKWSTVLAIAFCGIDFAGIARIFIPEERTKQTRELWYLFGAWFLAATANATLTWWGVSMAIVNHQLLSSAILSTDVLLKAVPVFVALIVWVTRILLITSFAQSGSRLFTGDTNSTPDRYRRTTSIYPEISRTVPKPANFNPSDKKPGSRQDREPEYISDPTGNSVAPAYHSISASGKKGNLSYR